jgi:signal transduction histidine kinase/DNA-binding response OmpR family regulator
VYGGDGFLWVSTSMGLNRFSLKDRKVTESYTEYPECLNVVSDSVGNTLLIKQKDFISCYSPETGSFQDVHVQGMNEEVSKVLFTNGERQFFILDADGCLLEICPDFESFPLVLDIKKTPIHEKEIDRAYYLDGTLYYVDMENHFYSYRMKDRRKEYLADLTGWMEQYGKLSRIALFHSVPYLVFRNGLLLNIDNQEEALRFDVGLFCVLPDRKQDILWVGTDGQGVRMYYDKYNRFSGIQLKSLPIVVRNPVRSIYTEDEKTIWFGTKGNGFVRVEDYDSYEKGKIPAEKVKHFTTSSGLSSDRVYCFRKSNYYPWVWIGTEGPGLSYYSLVDKKVHTMASLVDTKIRYVHAIREVNDSTLWMATTGDGLLEVVIGRKGGELVIKYVKSFILEKDGKICNEFHSMSYDDEASLLYLGSRGGYGLVRFNLLTKKYEFIPMNNAGNRAVGDVLCMCYSKDSTFYLGASSGMTQMKLHSGNPAEVRQYSRIDGIKNDMVHGILEDSDGCVWLSTNKGLTKYNPHNRFFHNYESPDLDVTEFSDDAYWKCPYTGKLFFGGINGVIWVDPQNDRQENYKPALHFFEMKMGHETHSLYDYTDQKTGYVTIPPNISTFSISFVATDYIHGENYEYSYLLENYNTSWTELQKDNEVVFTKLPYGNYVLKVRYKNDVFDSDAKEYFLHIRVLPPWYRGSWAMIAYGLVLATICLGIVYWLRRRIVEKQAEVARKIREEQKEKLYEAKFFANITHELCTPLTLINGVNDYIKISADRLADGKLEKYARILGENVTNLNELIQEILDIRKIEEVGFSHIQIKRVSVSSLIRKQCESFIPVAEQNGINFTFSDVDKPVYWNTDVPSLKKIIRNLVSNAFKYTEQKGTIDVSVRIENESLIIKVYNTGKGIAEADLKTIFDRFHILGDLDGNNYTQMTSRNGLGLFICHSMVQLLRGEINVESKEGESAGFIVTLPYLEVEEMDLDEQADEEVPVVQPVAAEATAETTGNIGNPVILVVDDNRDIVWLIKETLSSEYAVREAFNAEEALALMDQQTPDLIITDIMMPSMDGFALISRIKSDKFTRHIPLIVVSAKVSESEQAEGLDLGADVYLTKPFSSVVLHSVVNRLMANKKELKDYYYSPESAYEQSGGQLIHQEDKEFMDSVTAIIKENLAQDTLRPELIADKLGMNTRALYRRFKKISPLTPSDFIKDYRMMHAARLLVTTNLSVQEIIYQVGISNKSYFYREFSAKYGVTPGEYRRMQ